MSETVSETDAPVCECGTQMELSDTWTRSSIPLIGSNVDVREYTCPHCGMGTRLERTEGEDEWERASP